MRQRLLPKTVRAPNYSHLSLSGSPRRLLYNISFNERLYRSCTEVDERTAHHFPVGAMYDSYGRNNRHAWISEFLRWM